MTTTSRLTGWAGRLAAAGAVALLAGCSAPAPADSALKTIDANAFQSTVEAATEDLLVPGALVLVVTPQGRYTAEVGTTELDTANPPRPDTHFRIASNTKTMTAAVIVLLAQDGKLRFDDPVSRYIPGVPNGDAITIADLLKMRSGLYGYTDAPELATALDADPAKPWTPQQAIDIAFTRPPTTAPDTEYAYSNTNYALLGLVAEQVGGAPLATQFANRLFHPLGITHTLLPAPVDTSIPPPSSHGYMYGTTDYALIDKQYPADMQAAAHAGTLAPHDYTSQNSSCATAAGGAISTADDLAAWIRALVSGKVFEADYYRQWIDSLQAEDPSETEGKKYGYGISYQRFGPDAAMYYHGGELPGFNSFIGYDPDNDVALVIWTNLTLSPDGQTTANALLPTVLRQIYTKLSF